MKHKHADLIHAWADGAEIERKWSTSWSHCRIPVWYPHEEYRIKPEPKRDAVRYGCISSPNVEEINLTSCPYDYIPAAQTDIVKRFKQMGWVPPSLSKNPSA